MASGCHTGLRKSRSMKGVLSPTAENQGYLTEAGVLEPGQKNMWSFEAWSSGIQVTWCGWHEEISRRGGWEASRTRLRRNLPMTLHLNSFHPIIPWPWNKPVVLNIQGLILLEKRSVIKFLLCARKLFINEWMSILRKKIVCVHLEVVAETTSRVFHVPGWFLLWKANDWETYRISSCFSWPPESSLSRCPHYLFDSDAGRRR